MESTPNRIIFLNNSEVQKSSKNNDIKTPRKRKKVTSPPKRSPKKGEKIKIN